MKSRPPMHSNLLQIAKGTPIIDSEHGPGIAESIDAGGRIMVAGKMSRWCVWSSASRLLLYDPMHVAPREYRDGVGA